MARLFRYTDDGDWIADYTDSAGKRQRVSTKTKNKTVAARILEQLKLEAATSKFGLSTKSADLDLLINEFISYIGNTSEKHRQHTEKKIRTLVDTANWTQPKQITQYQVEIIVQQLKHPSTGKQLSLRSQSHYLTAIKAFTKWLTHVRKAISTDPLAVVRKPNFSGDRRIVRRFLLQSEWYWLSQTPNALLYMTAIQTGLRLSELLQLKPSSVKDDHVSLPGRSTKNKQAAKQYITSELRDQLRSKLPFNVGSRLAELLRDDLAIARELALAEGPLPKDFLQPIDSEGEVLDFHALRHTCGAWLTIAGVNPKTVQSVMRHSSIVITFDVYGHLMKGAEQEAASELAKMLHNPP